MLRYPKRTAASTLEPPSIFNKDQASLVERLALFQSEEEAQTYSAMGQAERDGRDQEVRALPVYALCLSGGGIRSAAFCLGVIQALAETKILRDFHYLSTVSGGGYIGSWLTRLIKEQGNCVVKAEAIVANDNANLAEPEKLELSQLRRYTNYLTPKPGLASADTWAGLILYIRNTLINWMIFLPLALSAAAVPIFCLNAVCWATWFNKRTHALWWFEPVFGGLALMALLTAATFTCLSLPSNIRSTDDKDKQGLTPVDIDRRIIGITMIWIFLVPFVAAPLLSPLQPDSLQRVFCPATLSPALAAIANSPAVLVALPAVIADNTAWLGRFIKPPAFLPLAALAAYLLGYVLTAVLVGLRYRRRKEDWRPHVRTFRLNFKFWVASSLISTLMLWIGALLVYQQSVLWIALAGPLWVVTAEILRSAIYVAVRSDGLYSDLDREWLARLNGDKLRWVLAISVLGATAVWLPMFIGHFKQGPIGAIVALIGIASGPIAAWAGRAVSTVYRYGEGNTRDNAKSDAGSKKNGGSKRKYIVLAAAALFGLTVFALSGRVIVILTGLHYPILTDFFGQNPFGLLGSDQQLAFGVAGCTVFVAFVLFGGTAIAVDRLINLNRFSMHAVYRNRLIRAFLGTARGYGARRPDPYTRFDPDDNIRIPKTWQKRKQKRLFHIINVSLNYTSGSDTARAERKAQPFTISPLHCGGPELREGKGAYVETHRFAAGEKETGPKDICDGITLGTAMAISGAAASPNMGYNSSPPAAFLMTLFNFRLGAWLPNPGYENPTAELLQQSGPRHAIPTLRRELAGRSNDSGEYVYLSDGGHFDNLGLYEMLRRRCKLIVVADAGADPGYTFFDLGHTLNMARVDLGVEISFQPDFKTGWDNKRSCTIGEITYLGECTGRLILIKPCCGDDIPIQLAAYGAIKRNFPHESTLDQFFTESDFECYRQLGKLLAEDMLQEIKTQNGIDEKSALQISDLIGEAATESADKPESNPASIPRAMGSMN